MIVLSVRDPGWRGSLYAVGELEVGWRGSVWELQNVNGEGRGL